MARVPCSTTASTSCLLASSYSSSWSGGTVRIKTWWRNSSPFHHRPNLLRYILSYIHCMGAIYSLWKCNEAPCTGMISPIRSHAPQNYYSTCSCRLFDITLIILASFRKHKVALRFLKTKSCARSAQSRAPIQRWRWVALSTVTLASSTTRAVIAVVRLRTCRQSPNRFANSTTTTKCKLICII